MYVCMYVYMYMFVRTFLKMALSSQIATTACQKSKMLCTCQFGESIYKQVSLDLTIYKMTSYI